MFGTAESNRELTHLVLMTNCSIAIVSPAPPYFSAQSPAARLLLSIYLSLQGVSPFQNQIFQN